MDTQVVVVDLNPDDTYDIESVCWDTIYLRAPMTQFHLSRALNIGIKFTSNTKYVLCTDAEMMFSSHYMAELESRMKPDCMAIAPCGTLPREVEVPAHEGCSQLSMGTTPIIAAP